VCAPFGHDARVIVVSQPHSGGYAPSVVRIEATDEALLERVAERAGIHLAADPPAWRLLRYSASIEDYEASLDWSSEPEPGWPRKDFAADSLTFRFVSIAGQARLSSFKSPVTHRKIYRIWRNGRAAIVDRDWGRWLYLKYAGAAALLFDSNAQCMAIPATVPLPGLLGRALTLFSGLVPFRRPHPAEAGLSVYVYSGVSPEAAKWFASKLGQEPSLINLS